VHHDVGLYNGMQYLKRSHIVGKVQGCVAAAVLTLSAPAAWARRRRTLTPIERVTMQLRPLCRLRYHLACACASPSVDACRSSTG